MRKIVKEIEKCPWKDYAGNPIFCGDRIKHPVSGEIGLVKLIKKEWKVDYGDGLLSNLALQIGDKGQAVIFNDH